MSSPTCWSEAEPGARKGKVVTTGAVPALNMSGASAVATSPASPNTQRIVKFSRAVYMWIFLIQAFISRPVYQKRTGGPRRTWLLAVLQEAAKDDRAG